MRHTSSTPFAEALIGKGFTPSHVTAYHRTGRAEGIDINALSDLITKISKKFIPGTGDLYGKGLYTTGDKKSQFSVGGADMMSYGNAVVEYVISLKNILIFDYRLSAKVHPGKETLEDQLIKMVPSLTIKNMPMIFQVLSEDLIKTSSSSNKLVSADRCKRVWTDSLQSGLPIHSLKNADADLNAAYAAAINDPSISAAKAIAKSSNIHGVAFVGGNDGSVVVVYDKFVDTDAKITQWCVSDPRYPTDETRLLYPWTPVGKGGSVQSMLVNKLAEIGIPTGKNSFDKVLIEGSNEKGVAGSVDFVKMNFKWLGSPLVQFKSLDIALLADKTAYITGGQWIRGDCPVDYFGTENDAIAQLKKAGQTSFQGNSTDLPIFHSGTFTGGNFTGVFTGGIFKSGIFNGLFKGGIIDLDAGARWGNTGRLDTSERTLKTSIRYKNKIWVIPPDITSFEAFIKTLDAGLTSTNQILDDHLEDAIKRFIPFKVISFVISDNYRGIRDITTAFNTFKSAYPWFLNKSLRQSWKDAPQIIATNDDLVVESGTLLTGTVYYTKYEKDVLINGGIIDGDNYFKGTFQAGIYNKGTFDGKFIAGIFNLDQAVWGTHATSKIDVSKKTRIIYKKNYIDIIPETFIIPDASGRKPLFNDLGDVLLSIGKGQYQKILAQITKETSLAKQGKGPYPKFIGKISNYLQKAGLTQVDDLNGDFSDEDLSDDDIAKLLASVDSNHRDNRSLRELYEAEYGKIPILAQEDISSENKHEFFNYREINEVVDFTIRSYDLLKINEAVYTYKNLSDDEQKRLYDVFRNSYQKATGAAFEQDDFNWRAAGWTFFGNAPDDKNPEGAVGGIAVRKQISNNMFKLVASFGDFRSVLKGFDEFKAKHGNDPVWGLVTQEIQNLILKHDKSFIALPGVVVKALEGTLKKISGGEVKSAGLDGVLKVDTPAGVINKVFLSNKAYVNWLLDSITDPANASRLPVSQTILAPLIGVIQKLL
jgi:hypothetical protein